MLYPIYFQVKEISPRFLDTKIVKINSIESYDRLFNVFSKNFGN